MGLELRVDSGVTLMPLIAAYAFGRNAGDLPKRVKRLSCVLAIVAGMFLFQYLMTKTIVPLAFGHKSQPFSRETFQAYSRFFLIPILPMMVILFRRGFDRLILFSVATMLNVSIFYSFFIHWHIERYVFPFAFSLFFVLLRAVFKDWKHADWRNVALLTIYASATFLAASCQGFSWVSGYRVAMGNAKQIAAAFEGAHLEKRYQVYACADAGYIAYKSGWKIIDLAGMTTPEVVRRDVSSVILETNPTVLIVTTDKQVDHPSDLRLQTQYRHEASPIPTTYQFVNYLTMPNKYWWSDAGYFYYIFVTNRASPYLVGRLRRVSVDADREIGFQKYIFNFLKQVSRRVYG
jgi:hypothetical protein